jgi:predicted aldo/keto reductase-like oxidoreductase
MVLSGMSNFAQLEDNTNYMKEFVPLNEDEQLIIKEVAKIVKEENTIPCTGCKYCVEGCPMKINIPGYFEIYNNSDNERKKKEQYEELVKNGSGRAQDCLKCGKCETACPQHLKIRDLLEKTY